MSGKIQIGIVGYGNLAHGLELALQKCNDMELKVIATRRLPETITPITTNVSVIGIDMLENWKNKIDVIILCGGSATDLPKQTPIYARLFNTVDSFDNHSQIPTYFNSVDVAARESSHISLISVGWDPGLFSLNRLYAEAVLPQGNTDTFWGRGVSQGHSDAIRRISGVKYAIQYTVPIQEALDAARTGIKTITPQQKHMRECFVVPEQNADCVKIEKEISEMPDYFAPYHTIVHFITEEDFHRNHNKMPHAGIVIRNGNTCPQNQQKIEYSLQLDSNPEFTAGVLVCYARAAYRMAQNGVCGAHSVFDVPPALLSPKTAAELRQLLL